MKQAIRPAIFKWRQTEPELIVWRRALVPSVLALVPRCRRTAQRARPGKRTTRPSGAGSSATVPNWRSGCAVISKPTNRSWRVDETYVRVKGRWCYLYRALDSTGATINFVLSGLRDAATAKHLFRKALTDPSHPQPRVINTDQARLYGSAIAGMKKEGILRRRCRHRPVQYLNNIVEPDHRAIKRRVKAKQGFRAFHAARANDPRLRGHAHDPEGASEVGERFGWSATDSVHQQLVRGGGMRRSPANSTNRSLAAFGKLQHIPHVRYCTILT